MQLLQDGCNGPEEIAAVLARVCRGMEKDVPTLTQTVSGCLATSSTASEQLSEPCKALLSGVGEVRKHIASGTGHKALLERLGDAVLVSALLSNRRSYQHHGYACSAGRATGNLDGARLMRHAALVSTTSTRFLLLLSTLSSFVAEDFRFQVFSREYC